MTRIWKVALGSEGQWEEDALANNVLTINFDIKDDISHIRNREGFLTMFQEMFPDGEPGAHQNFATQLTQFTLEMERGDIVVCPIKGNKTIAVARVVGDYKPKPGTGQPVRAVDWIAKDIPRANFGEDLLASFSTPVTISEVGAGKAVARVLSVIETGRDLKEPSPAIGPGTVRRFFLKVNGELHCPDGICRPVSDSDWEGGEVLVPAAGPIFAVEGSRPRAPDIQDGDELWIWTHEDEQFGRGWGLTAKATAGPQRQQGEFTAIRIRSVERLKRPFGYRDLDGDSTGSRLLDHTNAHRHHQAYLVDDDDYPEFLEVVEQKSRELPEEVRLGYAEGWEKEVLTHKDDLLNGLRTRRTTTRKARSGQGAFRDALFERYNGRCTISKCAVAEALEAAHVIPHTGDPKWDHPDNGMLLRRDLHSLFDALLWSIDPRSNRLRVDDRLKATSYRKLDGREIEHSVAPALLEVHFRQFKKGGIDD